MHVVEQAYGSIRYFNQNGLDSYHCKTCQHHPHLPRPQSGKENTIGAWGSEASPAYVAGQGRPQLP